MGKRGRFSIATPDISARSFSLPVRFASLSRAARCSASSRLEVRRLEDRAGAGDRLFLFTDGIAEASDDKGQEFEEGRIAAFAEANAALSAKELTSRLLAQVSGYCGADFQDDATLLVIAAN